MKVIHSIFSILLCFICIVYLLLYPQQNHVLFHDFSASALAAESGHSTLSDALALSMGTTYEEHISAHDSRYYCISFQKNISFQITSASIHNLKINFFSDTGKNISYSTQITKGAKTLTPSTNSFQNSERIFFCLANQSVKSCSIRIRVSCNKKQHINSPKKMTEKKHKHTAVPKKSSDTIEIPNPMTKKHNSILSTNLPKAKHHKNNQTSDSSKKNNNTTSNPAHHNTKQLSVKKLYPQFIKMSPDSTKKLKLSSNEPSHNFSWLSSNPLVATVANGTIHAIKEGITIIYIRQRNHPELSSSCFVRVLGNT